VPTNFRIASVDYTSEDINRLAPFMGTLVRKLAGPDRPDYWLAQLSNSIQWQESGRQHTVTYLVLAARYVGETIMARAQRLVVGISFVIDSSVVADASLDLSKCRYVAIGEMVSE
jgi:hypothetical protein